MSESERQFENEVRRTFEQALSEHRPEFEKFFLARLFGLTFSYPDDRCVIEFPVRRFMFNPQGSLHGGAIGFVLDVAMGHLLRHTFGRPGLTMEMKVQMFASIHGPKAHCDARFLHKGKSVCFLEARLFDTRGTLGAAATSTWRVSRPE